MSLYIVAAKRRNDSLDVRAESDFGPYGLLHALKSTIAHYLESDNWGSRFPLLMNRSDTDASYSPDEAYQLLTEIQQIKNELASFSPEQIVWARDPANAEPLLYMVNSKARTLADYLLTVDSENAIDTLIRICEIATRDKLEIIFT